jgi:superfamily I DNA/RNA helicase
VPQGGEAWRSVLREAVRREAAQAAERGPRYRHVVADEAQDLTAEHLMLLRAMVAPGPDDLFLAGDPGQRIYGDDGSPASLEILARLGIDVGDRATELAASHRLPPEPERRGARSWPDELEGIARQVTDWLAQAGDGGDGTGDGVSVGVALPDLPQVAEVVNYLDRQGIVVSAIGIDGPRVPDSVHVGTLRRFKGLEYERMLLAGLTASAPLTAPLLHMAATRARESLVISWHGPPSELLQG